MDNKKMSHLYSRNRTGDGLVTEYGCQPKMSHKNNTYNESEDKKHFEGWNSRNHNYLMIESNY